jgi:hypothetical protein
VREFLHHFPLMGITVDGDGDEMEMELESLEMQGRPNVACGVFVKG